MHSSETSNCLLSRLSVMVSKEHFGERSKVQALQTTLHMWLKRAGVSLHVWVPVLGFSRWSESLLWACVEYLQQVHNTWSTQAKQKVNKKTMNVRERIVKSKEVKCLGGYHLNLLAHICACARHRRKAVNVVHMGQTVCSHKCCRTVALCQYKHKHPHSVGETCFMSGISTDCYGNITSPTKDCKRIKGVTPIHD